VASPCLTANWPNAVRCWRTRPCSASLGNRLAPGRNRPIGAQDEQIDGPPRDGRSGSCAVATVDHLRRSPQTRPPDAVTQDQVASAAGGGVTRKHTGTNSSAAAGCARVVPGRPARPPRPRPHPRLGLGRDAVLEDGVEIGLDVVGIDLVVVVLFLSSSVPLGLVAVAGGGPPPPPSRSTSSSSLLVLAVIVIDEVVSEGTSGPLVLQVVGQLPARR
jgi:hypothetical protein